MRDKLKFGNLLYLSTFKLRCENVEEQCSKNLVRTSFRNNKQTVFDTFYSRM